MPLIRDALPGDREALAALLGELNYPAGAEEVARRLGVLSEGGDQAVLVAEVEGKVVGLGCIHVFPVLHADEPLGLITALVVAEGARSGGAGRALVEALEAYARSRGCVRVAVTTANQRAGAHAFYERLGYAHTGRRYVKQPI